MTDTITFRTTVHWCALFEPRAILITTRPTYGLAFDVTDAPTDLGQYLIPKPTSERIRAVRPDLSNLVYHTIRQPFAPIISLNERGDYAPLGRLREAAGLANISMNRLVSETQATIAVEIVDTDAHAWSLKPIAPINPELRLRAVRFNFDDIERRFEWLINQHFPEIKT